MNRKEAKIILETFESGDGLPHYKGCGVYAVFIKNIYSGAEHLAYIGSSKNIPKRIYSPTHVYRKLFDHFDGKMISVYTKVIYADDYLNIEKDLIKNLKPIFNKSGI